MVGISSPANDREEMWQFWAAAAQDGDKAAYNLLLRDIAPYIRNVLVPRLADTDWADDIMQEVLISVHRSLHTYSPDRPFKPWLLSIINFRRSDFLRRYYAVRGNKKTTTDSAEFKRGHVTEPAFAGELKDVENALALLPVKQREVFTLMRIEGYTAREVADRTGMSVSAVKVSVHRTAKKLKDILDYKDEDREEG